MTKKDKEFLANIVASQAVKTMQKFKKGVKEHGGHLWEKTGMLRNLEEELTDAPTYAYTLRLQLETARDALLQNKTDVTLVLLNDILSYDDTEEN